MMLVAHFKFIATARRPFLIYIYEVGIHRRGEDINHFCFFYSYYFLYFFSFNQFQLLGVRCALAVKFRQFSHYLQLRGNCQFTSLIISKDIWKFYVYRRWPIIFSVVF